MSQQAVDPDVSTKDPLISKVNSLLNEEKVQKDISSTQLSKIKSLDELCVELKNSDKFEEIQKLLKEALSESPDSLVSRYLLGTFAFQDSDDQNKYTLRTLLEDFKKAAKWTIVDHIADQILGIDGNNRFALRAKVESTERLHGKKELRPYLERLATVDRKNPDVVSKFGLSILEEDKTRALSFLKSAAETYARVKDYKNMEDIWNLVIEHDYEDLPFFERLERILVGDREKTRVAAYYVALLEPYRIAENWAAFIVILKKMLTYEPTSTRSRSELVRAYRALYADHSLLDDFLKMSELTNHKKAVGPCIESFERNIVFDKENYVFHRTRGVGNITTIDREQVIIDFRDNPGQRMSIQMAISSLKPLQTDHIWVKFYENPDEIHEIFKEDVPLFFEHLLSSFGYKMTLSEIKAEICERFIPIAEWSRWWSRARTRLKKEPKFGFNPRKKDELHLRKTPITLSEELSIKFQSLTDWNKKLELALETLKDVDTEGAAELCVQFYREHEVKNKDILKRLQAYLFLSAAQSIIEEEDVALPRGLTEKDVQDVIQAETQENLVLFCKETPAVDLKRDVVNKIIKYREDYTEILSEILFEVPIKVNKYVVTELHAKEEFETLSAFLKRSFAKFRDNPEVFLWSARSILTGVWEYDWIEATREEVVLTVFRLLKPIARYEKKGTRLKNMAVETIFGTTGITLESVHKAEGVILETIENASLSTLRRMQALFREVPYIPDAHKDNFVELIKEIKPDFTMESFMDGDDDAVGSKDDVVLVPAEGVILVSEAGLEKRRLYLDHLINVDMPANSNDIGEAQEKGDLRENAEYKAAMEKQSQLQAEIKKVDEEVKKATVIDPKAVRTDIVTIGCKVHVKTAEGEEKDFSILSSWDADSDLNIISYHSPLGKALLGKKPGETAKLDGPNSQKFEVMSIVSAL